MPKFKLVEAAYQHIQRYTLSCEVYASFLTPTMEEWTLIFTSRVPRKDHHVYLQTPYP